MKQILKNIRGYSAVDSDYVEEIDSVAARASIQGKRSTNEDAVVICKTNLSSFVTLTAKQRKKVLIDTFLELQNRYGQEIEMGSTGCLVVVWQKENNLEIYTVNLGDSLAYVAICGLKKLIHAESLNKLLHNPEPGNPEYDRIIALGVEPIDMGVWRLPTGLALSRALGDIESEEYGLSHVPDCYYQKFHLEENQQAFVILASDGLTEADVLNTNKIGAIVNKNKNKTLSQISLALLNAAYQKGEGSFDNITLAILKPTSAPISAAVFDGHGGNKVSQAAARHCYNVFKKLAEN